MTFVKVVGGTEIYNFCIQSFMHFYTKIWSFSMLNKGSTTRLGPEHRCATTSRAAACYVSCPRAGRPRRPSHAPPKATRRPRRAPSPRATPRGPWESSRPRSRHGPRRTSSVCATDRRSVGGARHTHTG
jgi:hypothetical protein